MVLLLLSYREDLFLLRSFPEEVRVAMPQWHAWLLNKGHANSSATFVLLPLGDGT